MKTLYDIETQIIGWYEVNEMAFECTKWNDGSVFGLITEGEALLTVMFQNLRPDLVGRALQHRVDLGTVPVGRGDLELDHWDLVSGVLEAHLATGDDVEAVLQQLDGGVGTDCDGDAALLGALKQTIEGSTC